MAHKTQRGREVAPLIRMAFVEAVRNMQLAGKPLAKLIQAKLEEDPLGTIKAMSGYIVKEIAIDESRSLTIKFEGLSATMELLESVKTELAGKQLPEPVPNRPLLSSTIRDDEEGLGAGVVIPEVSGDTEGP